MKIKLRARMLKAVSSLSLMMTAAGAYGTGSSKSLQIQHLDNPFVGAKWYVDPLWSQNARESGGAVVANNNTAVWMDRIAAITDGIGLRGHLDEAVNQGADLINIVIYNLPNRDCAAEASN